MACGAPIVASDTTPVREVMHDCWRGGVVDFFDVGAVAAKVEEMLALAGKGEPLTPLEGGARGYSRRAGLAGYDRVIGAAAGPFVDQKFA